MESKCRTKLNNISKLLVLKRKPITPKGSVGGRWDRIEPPQNVETRRNCSPKGEAVKMFASLAEYTIHKCHNSLCTM